MVNYLFNFGKRKPNDVLNDLRTIAEAVSMVDSRFEQPISTSRIRWVWSMGPTY